MRRFWILGVALVVGCSGGKLRPDPAEPSGPSNYPSAEIVACGERFVGLGRCLLEEGQDLRDLGFQVQGYSEGEIRVFSETLPIDFSFRYSGSYLFPIPVSGTLQGSAVLGIVVSPTYPGQHDDPIAVHPVVGFLLVDVARPGDQWKWKETRSAAGIDAFIELPTADSNEIDVTAPECGVQKTLPASGQMTRVWLHELGVDARFQGRCVFQFAVRDRLYSWMSWRYLATYRPMTLPEVKVDGKKLSVRGEDGVSIISLDEEVEIDREASFRWNAGKPHLLRLLSTKGRLVVGLWDPTRKAWEWKR